MVTMDKDKIIRNIKERMAISNLEKEYSMKMKAKRKMISISMVLMLFLVGSFVTVNAATGGQLANNVADNVKSWFIGADGSKQEIAPTNTYTAPDGETYDVWTVPVNVNGNNTAIQFLTDSNISNETVTMNQHADGTITVQMNSDTNTDTTNGN